mmetsp:Transcript_37968/g.81125  ORF Transcript_37968/g.81125 Transcript_37968/m.81125 type:complete len:241 (+) Transcript_37968:741-1463(+)
MLWRAPAPLPLCRVALRPARRDSSEAERADAGRGGAVRSHGGDGRDGHAGSLRRGRVGAVQPCPQHARPGGGDDPRQPAHDGYHGEVGDRATEALRCQARSDLPAVPGGEIGRIVRCSRRHRPVPSYRRRARRLRLWRAYRVGRALSALRRPLAPLRPQEVVGRGSLLRPRGRHTPSSPGVRPCGSPGERPPPAVRGVPPIGLPRAQGVNPRVGGDRVRDGAGARGGVRPRQPPCLEAVR